MYKIVKFFCLVSVVIVVIVMIGIVCVLGQVNDVGLNDFYFVYVSKW